MSYLDRLKSAPNLNVKPLVKLLAYGESGTGKTYPISTLLGAGKKIRLFALENNSLQTFIKGLEDYDQKVKSGKAPAYAEDAIGIYVPERKSRSLEEQIKFETRMLGMEAKAMREATDMKKSEKNDYVEFLKAMANFTDAVTGENFGKVTGDNTVVVVDSLTMLCNMIKLHCVGDKMQLSLPDYGTLQDRLMSFIYQVTDIQKCHIVMMAHPSDRTNDTTTGAQRIYPLSFGRAVETILPAAFTEVVWTYRKGGKFLWSTDESVAVTRHTHLPCSKEIEPDYSKLSIFKG